MPEIVFWKYYSNNVSDKKMEFYNECINTYLNLYNIIPELPLSHIYIAKELAPKMPDNCVIHFAIINALRAWNFFQIPSTIRTICNVGGFGTDGCTSSLIGASLVNKEKLYFLFSGDLAFFYDLNSLGNRHLGNNVRILLLNDGKGAEFTHYRAAEYKGDRDLFIAAAGHYGNQSSTLIKNFAENLGFKYLHANNKEEFLNNYKEFINPHMFDKPILFEVFANAQGQSDSWKILSELADSNIEDVARRFASNKLGMIKKIIKK